MAFRCADGAFVHQLHAKSCQTIFGNFVDMSESTWGATCSIQAGRMLCEPRRPCLGPKVEWSASGSACGVGNLRILNITMGALGSVFGCFGRREVLCSAGRSGFSGPVH